MTATTINQHLELWLIISIYWTKMALSWLPSFLPQTLAFVDFPTATQRRPSWINHLRHVSTQEKKCHRARIGRIWIACHCWKNCFVTCQVRLSSNQMEWQRWSRGQKREREGERETGSWSNRTGRKRKVTSKTMARLWKGAQYSRVRHLDRWGRHWLVPSNQASS